MKVYYRASKKVPRKRKPWTTGRRYKWMFRGLLAINIAVLWADHGPQVIDLIKSYIGRLWQM